MSNLKKIVIYFRSQFQNFSPSFLAKHIQIWSGSKKEGTQEDVKLWWRDTPSITLLSRHHYLSPYVNMASYNESISWLIHLWKQIPHDIIISEYILITRIILLTKTVLKCDSLGSHALSGQPIWQLQITIAV